MLTRNTGDGSKRLAALGLVPGGVSKDLHQTRLYGTIALMGAAHGGPPFGLWHILTESIPEAALIVTVLCRIVANIFSVW
jgi:hypothetical protein